MVANLKKQKGAAEKKIQYQKAERVKRKINKQLRRPQSSHGPRAAQLVLLTAFLGKNCL